MGSKKMDPKDIQKTARGYSCAQCGGTGDTSGTIKHNCPKCKYCDREWWRTDPRYDAANFQQQQQRLQQQRQRSQRQAGFR